MFYVTECTANIQLLSKDCVAFGGVLFAFIKSNVYFGRHWCVPLAVWTDMSPEYALVLRILSGDEN